ncbi:hypothetical protein [Actinomyces vulturis]|uniref:hypothetical protein n=1 Tax=Actinomyces vulturis TaxID=1857645 RepID=UPI000834883E|nr:hypothetical protein [Actinomyces vulturis]
MEFSQAANNTPTTSQPSLEGGAPKTLNEMLVTLNDGPRNALVYYSPTERIELSTHVTRMWMAKVCGLLSTEASPSSQVRLSLPWHWRTVMWASGALLAGHYVSFTTPTENIHDDAIASHVSAASTSSQTVTNDVSPYVPESLISSLLTQAFSQADYTDSSDHPLKEFWGDTVSVACNETALDDNADTQILTPLSSLALSWPGELPPLVIDGAADLMTYPDTLQPAPVSANTCAYSIHRSLLDSTFPTPPHGPMVTMTQQQVAYLVHAAAQKLNTYASSPLSPILLDGRTLSSASGILMTWAAWSCGRGVVILSPDCDEHTAQAAIRQEGC